MTPHRSLLPTLAPFLRRAPQSAIGSAFASLAQGLDPDQSHARRKIVLVVTWDSLGGTPVTWGEDYALYFPATAPSPEAWSQLARTYFRKQLPPGG